MARFLRQEMHRNIRKRTCWNDIALVRRKDHLLYDPARPEEWNGDKLSFHSIFIERGPGVPAEDLPTVHEMGNLYFRQLFLSNLYVLRAQQLGLRLKDVQDAEFAEGDSLGKMTIDRRIDTPDSTAAIITPYPGRQMLLSVEQAVAKEWSEDYDDQVLGYTLRLCTRSDKPFGVFHLFAMKKLVQSAAYRCVTLHGVRGSALSLYAPNKWNYFHSIETKNFR